MANRINKRQAPTVQAGSMADIAFLLLIFFLVTTTIIQEEGLLVQLPPYDNFNTPHKIAERNLLNVRLNARDQLLVEDTQIPVEMLPQRLPSHIPFFRRHPRRVLEAAHLGRFRNTFSPKSKPSS